MNENQIIDAVVKTYYPPRRSAVCTNVSWGVGLPWEADIVVVMPSGVTTEIEVKVDKYDLLGDHKKTKWNGAGIGLFEPTIPRVRWWIDAFWYAVPKELESIAIEVASKKGVGLYVVGEGGFCKVARRCDWTRRPKEFREKYVIKQADIWRLCALRYWDLPKGEIKKDLTAAGPVV